MAQKVPRRADRLRRFEKRGFCSSLMRDPHYYYAYEDCRNSWFGQLASKPHHLDALQVGPVRLLGCHNQEHGRPGLFIPCEIATHGYRQGFALPTLFAAEKVGLNSHVLPIQSLTSRLTSNSRASLEGSFLSPNICRSLVI